MALPLLAVASQLERAVIEEAERAKLAAKVAEEVAQTVSASYDKLDLNISVQLDLRRFLQASKKAKVAILIGCNRAAKPVKEAVISQAQGMARRGFLAASIGTKSKVFTNGNFVTVIGPKLSFSRSGSKITRGPRKGTTPKIFPYLYANVLESPRSGKRFRSFLAPAWRTAGPGYLARVQSEIAAELAKVI